MKGNTSLPTERCELCNGTGFYTVNEYDEEFNYTGSWKKVCVYCYKGIENDNYQ